MNRYITVTLDLENAETYTRLAVVPFVETTPGRHPVFSVKPTEVRVSPDIVVTVAAQWSPGNNMTSIIVHRDGKMIGHAGTCWHLGDPYLGLRLEGGGFLHLNCGHSTD